MYDKIMQGMNASRRIAIDCHKYEGLSTLHPVDLVENKP